MSITTEELKDTGGYVIDAKGPTTTTKRRFVVRADSSEDLLTTDLQAINSSGVIIGQVHPDYRRLVCTRLEAKRDPDNPLVWRVQASYETDTLTGPDSGPGKTNSQTWNLSVQAKFADRFRVEGSSGNPAPTGLPFVIPKEGDPLGSDIGGAAIDAGGDPQSALVSNPILTVDLEIETNPTAVVSFLAKCLQSAGKRNSSPFLGAKSGQLLYLGCQSRFLGNTIFGARYSIQHQMVFDEYLHRIQTPDRDLNRQGQYVVRLGALSDTDGGQNYVGKAFQVSWRQPFPELFDFRNLGIRL